MAFTLYNADWMDLLEELTTRKIACVVTDPPYGIGESNKKALSRGNAPGAMAAPIDYGEFDWDQFPISDAAISGLLTVAPQQVIFGGNYYADKLPASSGWIVWDKMNGANDFSDCELAWTSYSRGVRIIRYLWQGMIKAKPEQRYHPTQKPLAVMEWVIDNYTKPDTLILDPYMGSGTTGVACVRLGRDFVGVERDPRYFAVAQERIAQATRQIPLIDHTVFTPPQQAELFVLNHIYPS